VLLLLPPPPRLPLLLLLLHPFNGLFSRTAWVSRYQKGKTSLDLNEARDDGVLGCSGISWTICKLPAAPRSRQITTPTHYHSIFTNWLLFLTLKALKVVIQAVIQLSVYCRCGSWMFVSSPVNIVFIHVVPWTHSSGDNRRTAYFALLSVGIFIDNEIFKALCLQCFDAVGWVAGRASGL